jgi:UDP-N-acetylmuramyl pentapeptide phosphotransferase/UDP-N-acetylglucosamine-1-phosphate transferase
LFGGLAIGIAVWIGFVVWSAFGGLELPVSHHVYMALIYCIPPAIISTTVFWFLGWSPDNKALQLTAR